MRAPLAPIGWPRATAPPLTLTFSGFNSSCSHDGDRLDGERFVQFDEIDISQIPADLFDEFADGFDRRHHHQRRLDAADGLTNDSGHRFFAEGGRAVGRRHHYSGRTVIDSGRIARRHRAVFLECGFECAQRFDRSIGARRFVGIEQQRIAFALGNGDGNDLVPEVSARELQLQLSDGC